MPPVFIRATPARSPGNPEKRRETATVAAVTDQAVTVGASDAEPGHSLSELPGDLQSMHLLRRVQ
jgi:hypothetical protein